MAKVELSVYENGDREWFVERNTGIGTMALAFLTVGLQEVTGEDGPFESEKEAQKAAKKIGKKLEKQGVKVRIK